MIHVHSHVGTYNNSMILRKKPVRLLAATGTR